MGHGRSCTPAVRGPPDLTDPNLGPPVLLRPAMVRGVGLSGIRAEATRPQGRSPAVPRAGPALQLRGRSMAVVDCMEGPATGWHVRTGTEWNAERPCGAPGRPRWNARDDRGGGVPLSSRMQGRRIVERQAGPRAVFARHIHARCSTWNGAMWSCNRRMTVHSGVPPSLMALSRLLASVTSKRDRRHVVCGVPSSPLEVAVGDTTRHVRTVVSLLGP